MSKQPSDRFLAPTAIAAVVVVVGLMPMPYAYYMLMRIILCGIAAYGAVLQTERTSGLFWLLVGTAVLYNPIIPVYLGQKAVWSVVNIATLALFWKARLTCRAQVTDNATGEST